jgi:ParB family chromosome partitioning protein
MKLSNSFIAVKKIYSNVSRSNFLEDELNKAAKLILKAEGVINPVILRQTEINSYEVVDGDFEYYAAVRAKELDSQKGEYIGAYIIDADKDSGIEEQVKLFRKSSRTITNNSNIESNNTSVNFESNVFESRLINTESRTTYMESRITNVESRFETRITELQEKLRHEIKKVTEKLEEIENIIPKPIEPLEALNNISSKPEVISKLKRAKISQKIIESIVNERKKGKYTSFSNVVERIKGLGDKTMLKIIDSFTEGTI